MIEINSFVKVYFRSGLQIEGVVKSLEENTMMIKINGKKSLFIITDIKADVMGFEIHSNVFENHLTKSFEQAQAMPSNDPNRLPSLAKLKQELNALEREQIQDKLLDHTIGQTGFVKYGDQFSTFKSLKQYSK